MTQVTDHDPSICRARIIALQDWPEDPLVGPICDDCADAEISAMVASYDETRDDG